jgi:predicted NodU family carbamoyl transferase
MTRDFGRGPRFIMGAGTNHDAGLAVLDAAGRPLFAASLERLSRRKTDWGRPVDLLNWAEQTVATPLTSFVAFPLLDSRIFASESGFHDPEAIAAPVYKRYRWTAPEAVLSFPVGISRIHIHVPGEKEVNRRLEAEIALNDSPVGTLHNGKRRWSFTLPDGAEIRTLRIRALAPFQAPPPDARILGIMVSLIVGERAERITTCEIAGDSLAAVRCSARFLLKLAHLRRVGLRTPHAVEAARGLAYFSGLIAQGFASAADELMSPVPLDASYDHHLCHVASAYYPSGFHKALIVSLDGMGNEFSCRVFRGEDGELHHVESFFFEELPIGLNYETVTALLGFNPMRHAGKITGLAAYGTENPACAAALDDFFHQMWSAHGPEELAFEFLMRDRPRGLARLIELRGERFGNFSREDIAYAIQKRTEQEVTDLVLRYKQRFPHLENICLAGGVFANVRVNQVVHELGFGNIFVQPAMSDAGLAYGAALLHCAAGAGGKLAPYRLEHVFLGPEWTPEQMKEALARNNLAGDLLEEHELAEQVAELLMQKKVVAHFHGRMEYGPRALGNRSILYSAADPDVNRWLNEQLNRTEFMPFAPAVMAEHADDYFVGLDGARHAAEFMTITFRGTERAIREIPAAIHVDGTARPQLVVRDRNPRFHAILAAYHERMGVPVLINTSFNMHEEPIVASPDDAIRAFLLGKLDALVMGNYLVRR